MALSTNLLPPGFKIRAPRHEDAQAMADLLRACDIANYGEPDTDVDDVRDDWKAPHFDLARDAWLLVGPGGAAVGYAGVRARRAGADFDASLYVRPGETVQALAPALIDAVEARALEKSLGGGAVLCFLTASVEAAIRAVLEPLGYREVRTFFRMRIDLKPAATPAASAGSRRPAGIEVRGMRLGTDDRALHAALEESFAEHFRHAPRSFEEWWALRTSHPRFDSSLWLLAWDGARPAGALTAYDHGDTGFIYELGVLKPWRGRGVGTALLKRSFEDFRSRGQLRVVLGVDAENGNAMGLYERAGMRMEQRHHLMQKRLGA